MIVQQFHLARRSSEQDDGKGINVKLLPRVRQCTKSRHMPLIVHDRDGSICASDWQFQQAKVGDTRLNVPTNFTGNGGMNRVLLPIPADVPGEFYRVSKP